MKKVLRKMSEAEAIREFPIADRLPGWFFRLREISPGAYRVEGTDLWGRTISHSGTDEQHLLNECVEAARQIESQLDTP